MTITTGQGCQSCSRSASWTAGKMNYSLCPFAPENFWSRETGSAVPSRVSLLISILQAQSSACLRDFSRVPLRRPFIIDTHYVLWMQQYIYVYILCTMILAALSSCSVSSTNECSRIKQKCQGKTWKIQVKNFIFFANRNTLRDMQIQIKIHTVYTAPSITIWRTVTEKFHINEVFYSYRKKAPLKKNQNAPRPSEHPPVMGKKMSKRLGGIKGCKYKTSWWHSNRFPDADNIGSTV